MTVATTATRANYTGDGIITQFSFGFKTLDDAHMFPYLDGGVQGSGFTVTRNADQDASPGGVVDFAVAPAVDVLVTLERIVPNTQETDYTEYDPFPAETHETALDLAVMRAQQNADGLGRATVAPVTDDGTVDYTLPVAEALKTFRWNAAETALENTDDPAVSAAAALVSENNAATSESNAATSASNAATSESNAATSASNAATSESNASDSETAAAISASTSADIASAVAGTDTYTTTLGVSSYDTGKTYYLSFANTNTIAAPTLNLDALGAKIIKNLDGSALAIGAIPDEAFIRYDGTDMILLNPRVISGPTFVSSQFGGEYIKLSDVKASGTNGGTSLAATNQTRTLTTEDSDTGNNCSLSSNQFTLDAGTYVIQASAPANRALLHKIRLYNVSDVAYDIEGSSQYADNANAVDNRSHLNGLFTITSSKVFELRHFTSGAQATNGLGVAVSQGAEVYTTVELWKVK